MLDHSINYFTLLSQAIWKCKNWKENHRHFQLWRERHKSVKKPPTVFYFRTHDVHLCKCTISGKKIKKIFPYSMQSQMQRQCESELCEGILGRKSSRRGIGKFRAKLFFFSSFPIQICKLPCYQNAKEYFFLFLFLYKKKKSSMLHCLSFQSKPLGQCYREAVEVLQLEKRKIVLSAKQTPRSDLSMTICTCRMEAWSNTFCPALSHCCFQSHLHVCFQPGRTHTLFIWLTPKWTPPTAAQAAKQASIKTFTSQPVHKDRYFSLEFLGCWAQPN